MAAIKEAVCFLFVAPVVVPISCLACDGSHILLQLRRIENVADMLHRQEAFEQTYPEELLKIRDS